MSECFYLCAFFLICFLFYDIVSTKFLALSAFIGYLIYQNKKGKTKPTLITKWKGKLQVLFNMAAFNHDSSLHLKSQYSLSSSCVWALCTLRDPLVPSAHASSKSNRWIFSCLFSHPSRQIEGWGIEKYRTCFKCVNISFVFCWEMYFQKQN